MNKKRKKTLFIILTILLIIVIVGIFTFNAVISKVISKKVDSFLLKHPVAHYTVSYKRIGFNITKRSVNIVELAINPDNGYLDSLTSTGKSHIVPQFHIDKIMVSGIDILNIFKEKNISIGKIRILKLFVRLHKITGSKTKNKNSKPFPKSFKIKGLKRLLIQSFLLEKSKVELIDEQSKKIVASSQNIELEIKTFRLTPLIDSTSYLKPDFEEAILLMKESEYFLPNKLYKIETGNIAVNLKTKKVVISDFRYQPLYSKKAFSKHIKYQQERYDIALKSVELYLPNIKALLNNNTLSIHKILINKAKIGIYRDKQLPFPHFKRPLLPNQALKKMAIRLNIDTLTIKNSEFFYEELTSKNSQPLFINFTNLSASVTNVSNNKHRKYSESKMSAALSGRLMGKAPFALYIIIPMKAHNDTILFSGKIDRQVPFKIFNKATYPAAGIKFKDGTLKKLTFKGGLNPHYSKGTLTMLYKNLKLELTKKGKKKANKFLSWSANTAVRSNNPIGTHIPKTATISFKRDIEKGFGNYLWKTIFIGIKKTLLAGHNSTNKHGKKRR